MNNIHLAFMYLGAVKESRSIFPPTHYSGHFSLDGFRVGQPVPEPTGAP